VTDWSKADLIAIVEGAYDLRVTEEEWLQQLCDRTQAVAQADRGVAAFHVDTRQRDLLVGPVVISPDTAPEVREMLEGLGELFDRSARGELGLVERGKARFFQRAFRGSVEEPNTRLFWHERDPAGPRWIHTLGTSIRDQLTLVQTHIDGLGATMLVGGLDEPRSLRPAERALYYMLSAHVKAGMRLRQRLGPGAAERTEEAPEEGAVLDAGGEVLHAEGEAKGREERDALREAARRIDRARTRALGRGPEALAIWEGLIEGRWSLVERIDSDGKRLLLAHRNPHDVRDPRGLTPMETRVVGLAIRGYSDKLIAYHLGIAQGTASSHLTTAMRKLGVTNRVALVRRLGPLFPGPKREAAE
jgi:DNA-binding CsgD family transcriptional regulator